MLTQQLKGQLQSENEWKKKAHKIQNKVSYNIWVKMIIINSINNKNQSYNFGGNDDDKNNNYSNKKLGNRTEVRKRYI
jgi:hypothetical protein